MSVELKAGSISDFFASAKETAKEIDEKTKVTRKNIIWVDPIDLMAILKPERTKIVQYLRKKRRKCENNELKVKMWMKRNNLRKI